MRRVFAMTTFIETTDMKLLTLIAFLFPFSLFSQSSLSGKITDNSGQPFGYCKLILVRDSVPLQTVDTDTLGNYSMENIVEGDYQLYVKVPFKRIDTLITITGSTVFNLQIESENSLDLVEIKAKKPTVIRKVDRTIFDPSDIPMLVGGDASDVIEFAPGVYINGDDIQVTGGSSAQVMLNDKLIPLEGASLISFIRSIPTEDIQYIEIIPVPPVKYAASIRGSLINIQLVLGSKSRLSKGNITGDLGQHFYSRQGISGSYAYRKGKFSLYTNGSFNNNNYHFIRSKEIDYDTLLWNENRIDNLQSGYVNGSIGLNYELNSTTEIGVLASTYFYSNSDAENSAIEKTGANNSNYGRINNLTLNRGNEIQTSVNMNLVKRLDTLGQKIDFIVDYTNFDRTGNINFDTQSTNGTTDSLSSRRNLKVTSADFVSGGIDYVHPYKKFTFSLGGRYSYATNSSDLAVYDKLNSPNSPDTSESNVFQYSEQIQAAYSSFDWKVNSWSFQVGVRGENTMYNATSPTSELTYKNSYFQLIPKIFAMYETENGQFWNFNYSRDFFRPNYSDLNPFRYYTSAYNYRTGNTYLKPTIMHNLRVSTNFKDFQMNMSFGYINKMQTDVTIYDNVTQLQQTTVTNLFTAKSVDLGISYFKTIKKRTTIDASLSCMFMNRQVNAIISSQNLNNFSGFTYINWNQILDKKETFFFKATFMYLTPYLEQITRTTLKPTFYCSLKKNLLKNRISMELEFSDPFRLRTRNSMSRSNETIIKEYGYFDSQGIQFSFTYKLGNNRLSVNEHSTNSTGEAGRVGK